MVAGTPGKYSSKVKFAIINAAAGNNTIVAAVAGKKIRVLSLLVSITTSNVSVRFESGTGGGALTGEMRFSADQPIVFPYNPEGWFETAAGALLNLELGSAVSVDGCLSYVEVDA